MPAKIKSSYSTYVKYELFRSYLFYLIFSNCTEREASGRLFQRTKKSSILQLESLEPMMPRRHRFSLDFCGYVKMLGLRACHPVHNVADFDVVALVEHAFLVVVHELVLVAVEQIVCLC